MENVQRHAEQVLGQTPELSLSKKQTEELARASQPKLKNATPSIVQVFIYVDMITIRDKLINLFLPKFEKHSEFIL